MYKELTKKTIPLFLLNARITPKSFRRWNFFNKLSKNIFENIKIAYINDFPISTQAVKKNNSKYRKKTIQITPKSYKDEKIDEFKNRRTEAFEKLSNKDNLTKTLYKK